MPLRFYARKSLIIEPKKKENSLRFALETEKSSLLSPFFVTLKYLQRVSSLKNLIQYPDRHLVF